MATWTPRDSDDLGAGQILTTITTTALYENPIAIAEGAAGAPRIVSGAIDWSSVSNDIGQAQLKTAIGSASDSGSGSTHALVSWVPPGGTWGFVPQGESDTNSSNNNWTVGWRDRTGSNGISWTQPIFRVESNDVTGGGTETARARQRYVSSSPPYDLGDGEVGHFVEVHVQANGHIRQISESPDPPWAYNGPTDIRPHGYDKQGRPFRWERRPEMTMADVQSGRASMPEYIAALAEAESECVEITQAIKNADMHLVPRSILNPSGTACLLDPPATHDLRALYQEGEDLHHIIREGYIKIGDSCERCGPPGVIPVTWKWRQSGKR